MQEERLVRQLKHRNEKALGTLIQQYSAYVSTIIRNVGQKALSESDVEELTADVFISVWNNTDKLRTDAIRAYLAAIARNKTISHLRRMRETVPIDEIQIGDGSDIPSETESKLLRETLAALLEELAPAEKELLLRFYFYYQKVSRIAEEMHLSESACKTKLHRVRKKLLKRLKERGYGDEI